MNYLEKILSSLDETESNYCHEITAYGESIDEVVLKYAAPEYDKNYISNLLQDLAGGLIRASELRGFKMGLRHALKLVIESQHTPDKSISAREIIKDAFRRAGKADG